MTDRNNRKREFTYDGLNRQTKEKWLDATGNSIRTINSTYDAATQLTAVSDPDSSYNFTYDLLGRRTKVDNAGTPGVPNVVLNYSYDNQGNLLSVSDTINGQAKGTTAYTYDDLNRVTQITQSGNGVASKRVDFGFDNIDQYKSIDRYADLNGTQLVSGSSYTYDARNRLTNKMHSNATSTVAFYNFGYDNANRITQITDIDGVTDYDYDKTNQLTGADRTDNDNPDESYTYDENGNRITSSRHGSNYETVANNRLESDGIYNYQYDDQGNLIRRTEIATTKVTEYTWDYRNRLVAVIDKDAAGNVIQEVTFTYDAMNRRLSKAVDTNPQDTVDGAVTRFVYDRDNVLLDFVDSDGAAGVNAAVFDKRYLHGTRTDQVLATEDATGNVLWHLTDHIGTVRDLVNNSGSVVNHFTYDSFGNVVFQTLPTVESRYLFTGREFDKETGLYYYRARYYDGGVGRFIGEDPIGFDSGDTNLYRYVGNNTVNSIDPSGKLTFIIPGADGYGRLWQNVFLRSREKDVFPIGLNSAVAAALAVSLARTFWEDGERIYIMAHSAGNERAVLPVISSLRTFLESKNQQSKTSCKSPQFFFGEIYVGRLDPILSPKIPFAVGANRVVDVGSNNPGSTDWRDISSLLWPFFDFRADMGVSHNGLLDDTRVLDRLQQEYDFNF